MVLDLLNNNNSIKEQREELLKLNQDLLAWVYSLVEENNWELKLELVNNVLTCYPNHFEELKLLKNNKDITIINLWALRKWKVEVFSWNNIEDNNLVLLSNWVIEIVEAQNKDLEIKKHLISTLRDWWAADELQRTTTTGRNYSDNLDEDLEREHIEESPFLWYDKEGNLALATINNSVESIEILKESIKFYLDRKYLKYWDKNYEFAKKNFERNFPWIKYDDLWDILNDIINNNRVFTYSTQEENDFEWLWDDIKEVLLWNTKWKYFVYFDKDNNTIEYRLLRKITWFNDGFKPLSKRPSRLYLESENQYPRVPRVENATEGYVPTIKYFRDKIKLSISDIIVLGSEINEYDDLSEEVYERYLMTPDNEKKNFLKKYKKKYKSSKVEIRNKKRSKWILSLFKNNSLNNLPNKILLNLLEYIENKEKYNDLDCGWFVLFLNSLDTSVFNNWIRYIEWDINIWDIVWFWVRSNYSNWRVEFKSDHYGIYVWNWKYLSKLWRWYDNVVVMSEKALLKMYKTEEVWKYVLED